MIQMMASNPLSARAFRGSVVADAGPLTLDRVDPPTPHKVAKVAATAVLALGSLMGLASAIGLIGAPPPVAHTVMVMQQASPLTKVVQANFARWDGNHDGVLTAAEITQAVEDPSNHGDAAGALAALHETEMDQGNGLRFTLNNLGQYDKQYDIDSNYMMYRFSAQDMSNMPLFEPGGPTMPDVAQGPLGDCYLDSVLGRLAALNPQAIRNMIAQNHDGSFTVKFPGHAEPVTVPPLTDTEKALYGCAPSGIHPQGQWQLVLEKAAGTLRPFQWFGNGNKTPFDKLDSGFLAEWSIQLLTGSGSNVYFTHVQGLHDDFRDLPWIYDVSSRVMAGAPVSAHNDEGNLPAVRQVLTQAEANQKLVVVSTPQSDTQFGLPASHYVGVVTYDAKTDRVTIWNQWGEEPSDAQVQQQGRGVFSMSLANFCQGFQKITVQQ